MATLMGDLMDLRVSLVQTDLYWLDAAANREQFSRLLAPLAGNTDVVVLPEMFTTAFMMQPEQFAEPANGLTVVWLKQQAVALNAVVCGSVATQTAAGQYVNRFLWVTPQGEVDFYDKRHLFRMGNEHQHYQAGGVRKIFHYRGWRILPQICYDLRFPVFSRNQGDYELAIFVANWPAARRLPWRVLLQARAIENQAYVMGCNRVGSDGKGLAYSGDSLAINYKGDLLIDQPEGQAFIQTTTLSLQDLQRFREQFPALLDADRFELAL